MNDHSHEHHAVLDAIAAWIKKYREAIGTQNELANCTPEQVAAIARDMGLSPGELRFMAAKGPHAADELPKLLRALGVDPQQLASKDPGKMRDLQRIGGEIVLASALFDRGVVRVEMNPESYLRKLR